MEIEGLTNMVSVLEQCKVFPSPETVPEKSLPLTFFDLMYISLHLQSRVIFFDFPYSTTYFTQTLIPHLKTALSITLKHFFPLAGKLIVPSDIVSSNTTLQILYLKGDYISITFGICNDDYYHYSGCHRRDANILAPLVPDLPSPKLTCFAGEDCLASPVFAIQVTLFPNHGLCFGFTNSHVVTDGSSLFDFTKAWAAITKQLITSEEGKVVDTNELLASGLFSDPSYDRSLIKDSTGLCAMLKRNMAGQKLMMNKPNVVEGYTKCRATFIIKQAEIQALRRLVTSKRPTLPYMSSFTVVCAYIWICMLKVRVAVAEAEKKLDHDEYVNFQIAINCRTRLDPPLPASYFGNCILPTFTREKTKVLIGEDGLCTAAELLGKTIFEKLNVLKDEDKWFEIDYAGVLRGEWLLGVSGSPNLDYYNTIDFGWGKPRKFEFVSEGISASRCKDSKTDMELGFTLPKNEMDLFSTIFAQGLSQSA